MRYLYLALQQQRTYLLHKIPKWEVKKKQWLIRYIFHHNLRVDWLLNWKKSIAAATARKNVTGEDDDNDKNDDEEKEWLAL